MKIFCFFVKTCSLGAKLDFIDVGYSGNVLDILLQVLDQLVFSRKFVWVHSRCFGQMAHMSMLPLSTLSMNFCIHRIVLHIHATLLPAHIDLVKEFTFANLSDNGSRLHVILDLVSHEDVMVILLDSLRFESVGLARSTKFFHYLNVQK